MSTGKFYIHTFGCQMNVHDSQQMAQLLSDAGYTATDDAGRADIIIINTCSVREKAAQKVYSQLGRLKKLKRMRPGLIMGVAGCLAQEHGTEFFRRFGYLDLVLGTHNIHRLPEMIKEITNTQSRIVETAFHESVRSLGIRTLPPGGDVSAYVTIMQGCNNFCSYCIVPYVRGREESRDSVDIIDEIKLLADSGIREVTLLGQNVNSYGKTCDGEIDFPTLLRRINDIEGIERIRFTTSHPKDLSDDLVRCFADLDKLCEHIHLPVQSGSDYVLKEMKRGYTAEDYLVKIGMLKDVCPDISITSDIIVGFPGEGDDDFEKTIDLMKEVRFDNTFSFKYCDRRGTASELYEGKVEEKIKGDRLSTLQALQEQHSLESNRSLKGKVEDVLIEGVSTNNEADITGRTRGNKIVNLPGGADLIGRTVRVRIVRAYTHSLRGEMVEGERNVY
ncbi:MAG TPA: tRNA (N6-isopentenyl adenosine(37)-C2)-methylthiotransferase MiaB [Syntrophales bacterium]|nr:tRNA (N6-isopentenyl adenosine(37)-C2)-methylthiotransferase MiaB [Syntrophales bacterium]HPQ45190.1 tRNA (N6-isopentenyl adenosine(37)-C2)-methylthiotransferase MiaB [Syntrophales bacterium]